MFKPKMGERSKAKGAPFIPSYFYSAGYSEDSGTINNLNQSGPN